MAHILYLVHSLPPAENTGSPLVAKGYAEVLAAQGWDVTVVYGVDPSVTAWAAPRFDQRAGEPFVRIEVPITPYHGPRWSMQAASVRSGETLAGAGFARILRERGADIVHVVDNVNLPLELPEVAKTVGVPVVRTVSCAEDLCGLVAPVSPCSGPSGYCRPPLSPEQCAQCVMAALPELLASDPRETPPPGPELSLEAESAWWREDLLRSLQRKRARAVYQFREVFDQVIFSTAAFRGYFEQTLPLDPARTRVVPMGIDDTPWREHDRLRRVTPGPHEPVVLGLAGTIDPVKGAAALVEAFTAPELLERDDYRLLCIGGGSEALLAPLAANPRVELRGRYRPEEMPSQLAEMHVGLATSHFETFHRVTREYFLSGLPVVASRTLGVLDVVRHGENGLLFDHAEPGALARLIVALLDDRDLLERLAAGASSTPIRSVESEAGELAALYDEVIERARPSAERAAVPIAG